jgi:hypothetical protein
MLEGIFQGPEDPEDVIFWLDKHLQQSFGVSIYSLLGDGEEEDIQKVTAKFTNDHRQIWPWTRTTISFIVR